MSRPSGKAQTRQGADSRHAGHQKAPEAHDDVAWCRCGADGDRVTASQRGAGAGVAGVSPAASSGTRSRPKYPSNMPASPITDREEAEAQAFREQCRRQMACPLETRMKYGWCRVNRPVLDEPVTRIFSSTKAYREWCAANLPAYLGFQPAPDE